MDGEVHEPKTVDIDQLLSWFTMEERVYRMRCVEAWSMVIPWLGFPLAALLSRVKPTSHARYVTFTTLMDLEQLPGQKRSVLDWPYLEGLRLDEAMHPLTFMAMGLYGQQPFKAERQAAAAGGAVGSRAASPSCASRSRAPCRSPPGTWRRCTSTASTPT